MTAINLLPWREKRREEKKKRLIIALIMIFFLGILIIFIWYKKIEIEVDDQNSYNIKINSYINILNDEVVEIQDIKTNKQEMLKRMEVIKGLQGNRPITVRVFDQLVRAVPENLYFTELRLQGNELNIVGIAKANYQVSQLMRNISQSNLFTNPTLTAVKKIVVNGKDRNQFNLTVRQSHPKENNNKLQEKK